MLSQFYRANKQHLTPYLFLSPLPRLSPTLLNSRSMSTSPISPLPPLLGVVFDVDGTLTVPNLDFKVMYERCGVNKEDDILKAVGRMGEEGKIEAEGIIKEMEVESRDNLEVRNERCIKENRRHQRHRP